MTDPMIYIHSKDKFLLFKYWKRHFNCAERGLDYFDPSSYGLCEWSSEFLCTFLMISQIKLKCQDEIPKCKTIIEMIVEEPSRCGLLPCYGKVWLLESLIWLRKHDALGANINLNCDSLMHNISNDAYKFKVTSLLLKLEDHLYYSIYWESILSLLDTQACLAVIADLVDCHEINECQSHSIRDNLGLVALSNRPFVKIFLMRLVIYLTGNPEVISSLTKIRLSRELKVWQLSLGLIFLFNDHEGLLFKMLLSILQLELSNPYLFLPYHQVFCSTILYSDLIYRLDGKPEYLLNNILTIPVALKYLTSLYKSIKEDLLFNSECLFELREFHYRLNDIIINDPGQYHFLRPLSKLLQNLIE